VFSFCFHVLKWNFWKIFITCISLHCTNMYQFWHFTCTLWCYKCMVADLCHFVLSCFRGEKAKRRHAKTRQMVTCSCFRMATFRPATRKYDTFHASPFFRLLFVVSLSGGAKGRHAKTQHHHFAFSPRKHVYTTWHKSATIQMCVCLLLKL